MGDPIKIRIKNLASVVTPDEADTTVVDGNNGNRAWSYANVKARIAAAFRAAPTAFGLAPLGDDYKVPPAYLPASITGGLVYKGTLAGASVPATSTAAGDYYIIISAGTSQGKTWAIGDMAIYKGTSGQWDQVSEGVTQIAQGGSGATTAAAARAAYDVLSRAEALGRDTSQVPGGILFDARTSALCRVFSTLGSAGSIGTGEFSFWLRVRMPQACVSGTSNLAWIGTNSGGMGYDATFGAYYDTGGNVIVRLRTDSSNYIIRTLTGLRSTYQGQVIDLFFVRNASGLAVYVNGAVWSTYTDTAAGSGSWADLITSTYLGIGPCSTTGATQSYYRVALFNIALTAAEIAECETIGIPYRFKWATNAAATSAGIPYASDFSAGANGWTAPGIGAVAGNIDGIGGQDDNLRFTDNGSAGSHQCSRLTLLAAGKSYAFTGKVYIPSANTTLVEVRPYLNNSQLTNPITTTDAWTSWSAVATSDGRALQLLGQNAAHAHSFTGTNGDVFYAREVTVIPRGTIVDLDLCAGAGPQIMDMSSNGLHAAYLYFSMYGWEHKVNRRYGEFMVIRLLAHGDISATGGTTKLFDLPANCGLIEVEFDRETAFDAAITLDVGTSGTSGKYVNAQAVDATGKVLANSVSQVSESATAVTTVYIKKSGSTTQGLTTVRARCGVRG